MGAPAVGDFGLGGFWRTPAALTLGFFASTGQVRPQLRKIAEGAAAVSRLVDEHVEGSLGSGRDFARGLGGKLPLADPQRQRHGGRPNRLPLGSREIDGIAPSCAGR